MKAILAVAQERELVRTLRKNLKNAGYRVVAAADEQTALTVSGHEQPDLILMDLGQPEFNGFSACQRLRQTTDAPILVLTARVEEAERIVAHAVCADDYVLKPFNPRQLVARVQTLLLWAKRRDVVNSDVVRVGELELNLAHHQATVAGEPADLTPAELGLLAKLAAEPGRAFSRRQLVSALNGGRIISERTIDTHIKNLRAKIEPDPRQPRFILTVYGVGHKLSA